MMDELQEHINKEMQDTLKLHADHLEVANKEMGDIKITLTEHKGILDTLKTEVHSINAKQWAVIMLIVASAIAMMFK